MHKGGFVYIITNKNRTTLYIGVTSDLIGRVYQHKNHTYKKSFSDRYNLEFLVYYEAFERIEFAIARETEIKKWNRNKKESLIYGFNPDWNDLYDEVMNK